MKQNWKRFIALFMAIAMILVSGVLVTNSAFRASEDELSDAGGEIQSEETLQPEETTVPEEIPQETSQEGEITPEEDGEPVEETTSEQEELEEEIEALLEEADEEDMETVEVALNRNGAPDSVAMPASVKGQLIEGIIFLSDIPSLSNWTDEYGRTVTFRGWSTNPASTFDGGEAFNSREAVVEEGASLYAIWSVPVIVSVEYQNSVTQTGAARVQEDVYDVTYGGTKVVIMPEAPTLNYVSAYGMAWGMFACDLSSFPLGDFGTWRYYQATCGKPFEISYDVPMYAGTIQIETFYFYYNDNANGDAVEGMPEDLYLAAEADDENPGEGTAIYDVYGITFPGNLPSRTHYSFYEWNDRADDSGKTYTPGEKLVFSVNGEKIAEGWYALTEREWTVYAQWKPHAFIEFMPNGDGVLNLPENVEQEGEFDVATKIVTYSPVEIAGNPERPGYVFTGWALDEDGNKPVSGSIAPDARKLNGEVSHYQVFAQWTKINSIQIKAGDGNKVYDGKDEAGKDVGFSVIMGGKEVGITSINGDNIVLDNGITLVADIKATVSASEAKNAQTYPTVATVNLKDVLDNSGASVKEFYEMQAPQNGTYIIDPKPISMMSKNADKPYDGGYLKFDTKEDGMETLPELAQGDDYTITMTGKQLIVGESGNTYDFAFAEGTLASNYTVDKGVGTLKVTGAKDPIYTIYVSGDNKDEVYNTKSYTVDTYKINGTEASQGFVGTIKSWFSDNEYPQFEIENEDGSTDKYTLVVEVNPAEGVNAGKYTEEITGVKVYKGLGISQDSDVTTLFKVVKEDGSLTIKKAPVTLTAPSAEKDFDGAALTNNNIDEIEISNSTIFESDGFDKYDYVITGEQTEVGHSDNVLAIPTPKDPAVDNYAITVLPGTLTVNGQASYEVEITAKSDSQTYNGESLTVSGYTLKNADGSSSESYINQDNGQLEIKYTGADKLTYTITGLFAQRTETNVNPKDEPGTYQAYPVEITGTAKVLDKDGKEVPAEKFAIGLNSGELTIIPRQATITSATKSKPFDGNALTNGTDPLKQDNFVDGEGVEVEFTGTITDPGETDNTFINVTAKEGTLLTNYSIDEVFGKLKVTNRDAKYEVTLHGKGFEKTYDGNTETVEGFTETLTGKGYEVTVDDNTYYVSGPTSRGQATDVDDSGNTTTSSAGFKVVTATGTDVTGQFNVTALPGVMKIKPAEVTLTSGTASKVYDGKALTNANGGENGEPLEFVQEGFVDGQGVTPTFTASITAPGQETNSYTYKFNAGTKETNYSVTPNYGTLTVDPVDKKYVITLHGESGSKTYDGEPLEVSGFKETLTDDGYEVTFNGETYYVSNVYSEGSITNVTESGLVPVRTSGYVVLDSAKKDVTSQFAVEVEQGTMTVNPREVTLKTFNNQKEYDGKALTDHRFEAINFVGEEGVNETVTGTITQKGSTKNTFDYVFKSNTDEKNYKVNIEEGTLTIIDRTAKYDITLHGLGGSKEYDGEPLNVSGFEEELGKYGYTVTVDDMTYYVTNVESEGSMTDAATDVEVPNTVLGFTVYDENGNDVTSQFNVDIDPGKMTITPAPITLKAPSDEKEYDSEALVSNNKEDIEVIGDKADLFKKEAFDNYNYTINGSQTEVGSSPNVLEQPVLKDPTKAENFKITVEPGTLTVTGDAEYSIVITANSNSGEYDGTAHTATGYTLKNSDGTISAYNPETKSIEYKYINDKNKELTFTITGLTAERSEVNADTYVVTVDGDIHIENQSGQDVTDKFSVDRKEGYLNIAKRPATVASAKASKEYDGQPLTADDPEKDFTATGFVPGEGVIPTITGTITNPGEAPNTFSYIADENTNLDNYTITPTVGTLTITDRTKKLVVTLNANSLDTTYDGTTQSISGFQEEFVQGYGYKVELNGTTYYVSGVTSEASGKDVADSVETIVPDTSNYRVKLEDGTDLTNSIAVDVNEGYLKINPKAATVRSQSASKVFDTFALTNDNAGEDGSALPLVTTGFVSGEGVETTFTASITNVGVVPNDYVGYEDAPKLTPIGSTDINNYAITFERGTLSITKVENPYVLTIHANSDSKVYDGMPLHVSGFVEGKEALGVPATYKGATYYIQGVSASASGTNVSDTKDVVGTTTDDYKIVDANNVDVTDNFTVDMKPGRLTIEKRDATVESQDGSKNFDSLPLTNDNAGEGGTPLPLITTGFVDGEGVSATFTASIVNPNTVPNAFENIVPLEGTQTDLNNYNITPSFGTLTVIRVDGLVIELTGKDATAQYDGKTHTAEGFTETIAEYGYTVNVGGQTYYVDPATVSSVRSGKDVVDSGKTEVDTSNAKVYTAAGVDVTENFTVTGKPGTLTIKRAPLHLKSDSAKKLYDGNALTAPSMEIEEGWIGSDSATYQYNGTQTLVGTSWNKYDIKPASGVDMNNYDLNQEYGVLKVTDVDEDGNIPNGVVEKGHDKNADGSEIIYTEGKKVEFKIKVHNIYQTTMDVTILEQEGVSFADGKSTMTITMAPDAVEEISAFHTVTPADLNGADNGIYHNDVKVSFKYAGGPDDTDRPERPDDGGDYEDSDEVPEFIEKPAIFVDKQANVTMAAIGETIEYTIVVTNQGNVDLDNVEVKDDLTGDSWKIDTLKKGASETYTARYTVKEQDVAAGNVKNVAVASAKDPRDPDLVPKDDNNNPIPVKDDDDETVDISTEFTLTIHYVDTQGNTLANDYSQVLKYADVFKVQSPSISGYVLVDEYQAVMAGTMPATNVELTVVYEQAPEEPVVPEEPTTPDDPTVVPPTPGTIVTVDPTTGEVSLTRVDDVDTALANLDLGEHIDNILYFLILLCTTVAFYIYCRDAKKHQKRIFELRSELGEDDPYRKEQKRK